MLRCPVRACTEPLAWLAKTASCPRGHAFDVSRSGYLNLLQPQDKRSLQAGDPRVAVLARRRCLERGFLDPLLCSVEARIRALEICADATWLDVGCGEGTALGSLAPPLHLQGIGVDLSVPAIDLAARTWPAQRWIVANADRTLPFENHVVAVITSITARRNPRELRRILRPDGHLILAVAGPDDLVELREALFGQATEKNREASAIAELRDDFTLMDACNVRNTVDLDQSALSDLLASTYRGARHREQALGARISTLRTTLSHRILVFRPIAGEGPEKLLTSSIRSAIVGSM